MSTIQPNIREPVSDELALVRAAKRGDDQAFFLEPLAIAAMSSGSCQRFSGRSPAVCLALNTAKQQRTIHVHEGFRTALHVWSGKHELQRREIAHKYKVFREANLCRQML